MQSEYATTKQHHALCVVMAHTTSLTQPRHYYCSWLFCAMASQHWNHTPQQALYTLHGHYKSLPICNHPRHHHCCMANAVHGLHGPDPDIQSLPKFSAEFMPVLASRACTMLKMEGPATSCAVLCALQPTNQPSTQFWVNIVHCCHASVLAPA